jgi:hypothetical protein
MYTMADNNNPRYEEGGYTIMASNIFNELCIRDREDRERGNPPAWNDITELAGHVRAFDNITDVAYIAEANLLDELHYIDHDRHNQNVRLTTTGRENCGRGIQIPRSTNTLQVNLD